jgi:hypothetical protein
MSKLRVAIAKEEKPLENMMRKTLKKRVCKKHRKFTGFTGSVLKKFKLVCQ